MSSFGKLRQAQNSPCGTLSSSSSAGGEVASRGAGRDGKRGPPGIPFDWIERNRIMRLVPVYEDQIDDVPHMIGVLARALRAERKRGESCHWSYDPLRHMVLERHLRQYQEMNNAAQ